MSNRLQPISVGLSAVPQRHRTSALCSSNIEGFSQMVRAIRHQPAVENQADGPSFVARTDTLRNFLDRARLEGAEANPPRPEPALSREDEVTPSIGVTLDAQGLLSAVPPPSPAEDRPRFQAGLEPVIAELVRSIAWGGDRRRGTVRLELGGRYAGAVLKIDASGNALDIELDAPSGLDGAALGARLAERFAERGLSVDSLVIR